MKLETTQSHPWNHNEPKLHIFIGSHIICSIIHRRCAAVLAELQELQVELVVASFILPDHQPPWPGSDWLSSPVSPGSGRHLRAKDRGVGTAMSGP